MVSWVLAGSLAPSRALSVFRAQPRSAPLLMCACSLHASCFSVFFLAGLRLEATGWLVLGVACLLLFSGGLVRLLHGFLLPRYLAALIKCLFFPFALS